MTKVYAPLLVNAVKEIASIGGTFKANLIARLGDTSNGIVSLFAKNIYATNITADHGSFNTPTASSTLTSELCVDDICVTRDQFKAMVETSALSGGSVLGASTKHQEEAAAGASADDGQHQDQAPAALPAPTAEVNADSATSSTPSDIAPITSATSSTPGVAVPANDNAATSTP